MAATIAAVGLGIVGSSCKEPTSVVIEVRTTVPVGDVRATMFAVGGNPGEAEQKAALGSVDAVTKSVDPSGFVGTLVAVPSNGDGSRLAVVIVLGVGVAPQTCKPPDYKGCIVARRSLAYRANERLRLPIVIEPACVNVPCSPTTTCQKGSCYESSVSCDAANVCASPGDNGSPVDGGGDGNDGTLPDGTLPDGARPDGSTNDGATGDAKADAPDGGNTFDGSTPNAGLVFCPAPATDCVLGEPSNERCCTKSGAGTCAIPEVACTVGSYELYCDGPEDCPAITPYCCIAGTTASCKGLCVSGNILCHSSNECPSLSTCTGVYAGYYGTCETPP